MPSAPTEPCTTLLVYGRRTRWLSVRCFCPCPRPSSAFRLQATSMAASLQRPVVTTHASSQIQAQRTRVLRRFSRTSLTEGRLPSATTVVLLTTEDQSLEALGHRTIDDQDGQQRLSHLAEGVCDNSSIQLVFRREVVEQRRPANAGALCDVGQTRPTVSLCCKLPAPGIEDAGGSRWSAWVFAWPCHCAILPTHE